MPETPMSYREALVVIEGRGNAIAPGLERIEALADLLDHPERTYPTIQVAGTNGKSSTARILGAILAAHGLNAGVYTSPHLQSLRERYLLMGRTEDGVAADLIAQSDFAGLVQYLLPFVGLVERERGESVTYFEFTTALAFEWMSTNSVGVGVYETGLGGTWDATNIVGGDAGVFTAIDVDHIALLGDTPLANAREKAGIIKPARRYVSAPQRPDVRALLESVAGEKGSTLAFLGDDGFGLPANESAVGGRLIDVDGPRGGRYRELFVPLFGTHQGVNAAVAIGAAEEFLERPLEEDLVAEGLAAVTSPGRMEVVGHEPLILLDGAHNPAGAAALAKALAETFGRRPWTMVVSVFADKDIDGVLGALLPGASRVLFTANRNERAAPPERLQAVAARLGFSGEIAGDLAEAIATARAGTHPEGVVVVTGSLATVGEARTLLVGPVP